MESIFSHLAAVDPVAFQQANYCFIDRDALWAPHSKKELLTPPPLLFLISLLVAAAEALSSFAAAAAAAVDVDLLHFFPSAFLFGFLANAATRGQTGFLNPIPNEYKVKVNNGVIIGVKY